MALGMTIGSGHGRDGLSCLVIENGEVEYFYSLVLSSSSLLLSLPSSEGKGRAKCWDVMINGIRSWVECSSSSSSSDCC